MELLVSRLLEYLLPGIILAAIVLAVDFSLISQQAHVSPLLDFLLTILPLLCIIVPSAIYYIKMPPGKDTRP